MAKIPDPMTMTDPQKVRNLMANAIRLGETQIAKACQERIYQLAGLPYETPLDRRFWETVAAYEEFLTQKNNGRKTRASRTRQMLGKKTIPEIIAQLTLKPDPSGGFEGLVAAGHARYVFEHIVAEFPDEFAHNVVDAALIRLSENDIELPQTLLDHINSRA